MNICYSGGSKGADKLFGDLANSVGHKVYHWSFQNHFSPCDPKDIYKLNDFQLSQANEHLLLANKYLQRIFPTRSEYVNNLLRRNYYQIVNAERIYSTTPLTDDKKPLGGTAWALVMGMQKGISEIYNYEPVESQWYFYTGMMWVPTNLENIPPPHGKYAGIGSSELSDNAREAVKDLYRTLLV